jgi:tetratricopeptide (TPR) repeat protein
LLRWQGGTKTYVLSDKGIDVTIALADVVKLSVVRPKELDPAIRAVRENNGAVAIATLAKIATDYFMLQHDEEATRWLAEAYLQGNNGAEAIRAIERITAVRPEAAYLGDLATVYWRALLRENRTSKLDDFLVQAVKSGNRLASATALLLRGDMILKGGDTQDFHIRALKDGYLRVVTLYRTVKEVQPEANYKAAKSLEKLGMTARAQERRETIRKEFPGSEWAGKP